MTDKISELAEDRLLRMMADQQEEIATIGKNLSERVGALEKRPRRALSGLLDMDFENVASIALLIVGAFILVRVVIAALVQMKKRGDG